MDRLDEPTSEGYYADALADEQPWVLDPDGTLSPDQADPAQGRAWGRDTRRAWGQP